MARKQQALALDRTGDLPGILHVYIPGQSRASVLVPGRATGLLGQPMNAEGWGVWGQSYPAQADSRHLVVPAGLAMGLGTGAVYSRLGVILQTARC